MGYFCLPKGDRSGDLVVCAMHNLALFMENWKHDKGEIRCSSDYPDDHLLEMSINYLSKALVTYRQECEVNPNINPYQEPDPPVDIEQAKQSAKGDDVADCSKLLRFVSTHTFAEIDDLMVALINQETSNLGYTAVLRYTWQIRDKLNCWYAMRNMYIDKLVAAGEDPKAELIGLVDLEPEL